MNELQVSFGGRSFRFPAGQTVRIGRSPDNDIVVSEPSVSRQHAQLSVAGGGWVFENVGRAATFLGGQQVTRVVVSQSMDLVLASPQGPVLQVMAGPAATGQTTQGATDADAPSGTPDRHTHLLNVPPQGGPHGQPAAATSQDLATALQILIPVRSWLKNPGWSQLVRLLVIPYGLLPLAFLALFASSQSLTTPGWVYSMYVAPMWAVAFWLLIRPGALGRQEAVIGIGVAAWVLVWIQLVTVPINDHLGTVNQSLNLVDALIVGINEESTKALPVLIAAMLLLKLRSIKLGPRMWMFLGTIGGLTFGVAEAALYTPEYIVDIHSATINSQAVSYILLFADRVFVDGFDHAIWAGVSAFFIGVAVNYPRRRVPLIVLGVAMAAFLHALNDWTAPHIWVQIMVQCLSLFLFLGYTMSATSIERQVRRTAIFRGDSMLMERISESGEFSR